MAKYLDRYVVKRKYDGRIIEALGAYKTKREAEKKRVKEYKKRGDSPRSPIVILKKRL